MRLSIEKVSKNFTAQHGKVLALDEISIQIKEGEFICFVGPSGCGKTTLLNMVAGLETPTKGVVRQSGEEIKIPSSDRVVIFQEAALFPWLNVIQNVEFGLVRRMNVRKRREISRTFLNLVHLGRFENAYVHQLSGGMKSRVAIARALALNPSILLMDEPFAALDAQTRDILHEEIEEIWFQTKQTIVFVTHNVREAVRLGDRVFVFTARPGRIKKEFQIDLPRPRDTNSESVVLYAKLIQQELREEIEKFLKEEVDRDWSLKKANLLRPAGIDLGSGI
ncbi:MAG: nitrate/sulfonate/bicarbonate ABC transporter ATP-binding protein [Omnitrophica bacterium RIFCSPHIGHO2_02_FULL_46_11]|nr:MAG: nitrate/sulfonate/bicarbonate ABC transporter ATP-binding protein [Omnitrophica bacterium RIFCSPLOWO2_01_FULL_45_10b]OGW86506.1 MAG: nitrate/sulfonate/bicarbonate ABC transporter ATP-binding protein [Omnitrophica bacterium RIFCSPHIGHO2_02_FULL_46_11]